MVAKRASPQSAAKKRTGASTMTLGALVGARKPVALPAEGPFAAVAAELSPTPLVTLEPGWGRDNLALKRAGKIVAMLVSGELVVKLSRIRVDALVAAGVGERFDPRKNGRVMKEWLVVAENAADWVALAQEALVLSQESAPAG